MSASLVGSEMCIRDRGCAGGARHATRHGKDRRPCRKALASWRCPARPACLLYTSDAADDM
eukprot:14422723-Alexandrium_andersonii.AAC.1